MQSKKKQPNRPAAAPFAGTVLTPTIQKLNTGDGPEQYKAKAALRFKAAALGVPGNAERAGFAAALAAELNARKPNGEALYQPATRREIARTLSEVATATEVPALLIAAQDLEVREMARYVLARIAGEEAVKALAVAANDLGREYRIGAINSLGRRTEPSAAVALTAVSKDADATVRRAAAAALANFPMPENDAVIVEAFKGVGLSHGGANKYRLRLAYTLAKAGNKAAAADILAKVGAGPTTKGQAKAVKNGAAA